MKQMTQAQMARATGFTEGYISLIRSGDRTVRVYATAEKLAKASDTDPMLWLKGSLDEINEVFISRKGQAA